MVGAMKADSHECQPFRKLPASPDDLLEIDIDAVAATASDHTCYSLNDAFSAAAKSAKDAGNAAAGRALETIQIICSYQPNFYSPGEPFRPMWRDDKMRSALPEDFEGDDIALIAILAGRTSTPALKARLIDTLFLRH